MPTNSTPQSQDLYVQIQSTIFDLNTALDRPNISASERQSLLSYLSKLRGLSDQVMANPSAEVMSIGASTVVAAQASVVPVLSRATTSPAPRPASSVVTAPARVDPNAPVLAVSADNAGEGLNRQQRFGMVVGALGFGALMGALAYWLDRRS